MKGKLRLNAKQAELRQPSMFKKFHEKEMEWKIPSGVKRVKSIFFYLFVLFSWLCTVHTGNRIR